MTRLLRLQSERIDSAQARARAALRETDRLMAELLHVQRLIAARRRR